MTNLTKQFEFKNVDWVAAGAGNARDGETTVSVAGVNGDVKFAFMYWGELNFSGSSDNTVTLNGTTVSGQFLGTSVDTCWDSDESLGYFADVTALVQADGNYTIAGMGAGGQGATIVVVYDDGTVANNRDLAFYAGNDSTNVRDTPGQVTTIDLGNIDYTEGQVNVTLSVGDGQAFVDGDLAANGTTLGTNQFNGSAGALWDLKTYDITSVLSAGSNTVTLTNVSDNDCLQFVSAIVDKASQAPTLLLDFDTAIPLDYYTAAADFFGLIGLSAKEVIMTRAGTEPLGVFTALQKAELVQLVQDIFDRSGIAMNVTQVKPTSGDYHSVRFSSTDLTYKTNFLGTQESRLLGQAFQGIDRFDTDKNNITAVLMDGNDAIGFVSETVAHEGAHAFGARHINPLPGNGTEVMDYDARGLETFHDQPAFITEPPEDGAAPGALTHNPTYHLRRYVNGESDLQLSMEGIRPGTWDVGGPAGSAASGRLITYALDLSGLAASLTTLAVLVPDQPALVEGPVGTGTDRLIPLGEDLANGTRVEFTLPEGTEFRIVGATGDDTRLDTMLHFGIAGGDPFITDAAPGGPLSGTLLNQNAQGNPAMVGQAALAVTQVTDISPDPLPVLTVRLDTDVMFETDGEATVTVSRGTATTGDLTVILSSDDTSEAVIQGSVVIPDGQSQVDVALSALDDILSDGPRVATITALAEGYANGSARITVLDNETPMAVLGTPGNDVFPGTPGDDVYFGLDGNDLVFGQAGGDALHGNGGADTVLGGQGADLMTGGPGADILIGGPFPAVPDSLDAQIFRLYQATLDRLPDAGGLAAWVNAVGSGQSTLLAATGAFVTSQEFQATYGALNTTQFVTLLYNNVLDRAPDPTGLQNWVDAIDGGQSRAFVVLGFSNSLEFKQNTSAVASAFVQAGDSGQFMDDVFRLYQATLDRAPDNAGQQAWARQLANGSDYLEVASGFVGSAEFTATYGALDDTAFVTQLYRNVLDREPDPSGLQFWLGELTAGASRASIVRGLAQSVEFTVGQAEPFRAFMRAQTGDTLSGGEGDDILIGNDNLSDTFAFHASEPGRDRVLGMDAWDSLLFEGFGYADRADARAHMTVSGSDVVFSDLDVVVRFVDTTMAEIELATILV